MRQIFSILVMFVVSSLWSPWLDPPEAVAASRERNTVTYASFTSTSDSWDSDEGEGDGAGHTAGDPGPIVYDGEATFRYRDSGYIQVYLTGSFTDWVRVPMRKRGDLWTITMELPSGRQYYRFTVNDRHETWDAIDPGNSDARNLAEHGWVSILRIPEDDDRSTRERRKKSRRSRGAYTRIETELEIDQPGGSIISYQRVDGFSLGFSLSHIAGRGMEPSARGHLSYGFGSDRVSAGFTVLQPLLPHNALWLKFSGYDRTDYTRRTGVGSLENSLAMTFFREDYRDYYRRRGVTASLVLNPWPWLRLQGGMHANEFSSLDNTTTWSFKSGEFVPNPPADDGLMRSLFGEARFGRTFNYLSVTYERSGENLMGGDFSFEQITATYRGRLTLGPRAHLDVRLMAGSNFRDTLPAQRRYVLGGLGTIRGYGYQSVLTLDPEGGYTNTDGQHYGGERMVMANAEYAFRLGGPITMILFGDTGMAWEDRTTIPSFDELETSAGIGFKLGKKSDGLRVNVIQQLDTPKSDALVQIRINRMF